MRGADIGWAAEYHRRMRKFNLEAVLAASLGLVILIIFSSDELVGFLMAVCIPEPQVDKLDRHTPYCHPEPTAVCVQ